MDIKSGIREFLNNFDFKESREEVMENTPRRVEEFVKEFFNPGVLDLKKFRINHGGGVIKVSGIKFYALCQHHLLPFFGEVEIEIKLKRWALGLSKYARVVDWVSRQKPTLQENLAYDIASVLKRELKPEWVKVRVTARHLCIEMRGIKKETENVYECKL